jgi:hypothetical protein
MTLKQQRKLLSAIKAWMSKRLGKGEMANIIFETGDVGITYSKYACKEHPWISFEGSCLYDLLNGHVNNFSFVDDFTDFLEGMGVYYEMNHSWDLSIYSI